jgi:hypothetical protein
MGQDEDDNAEAKRDNRGAQRDRVLKGGQVTFGNSVLDCIVLDISVSGARVSFSGPVLVLVPEVVALKLRDGSTYPARCSWARGAELGLEFTGRIGASGDEGRIRRAWAALEAVQAADPVSWLQILRAERFFGDEMLHQAAKTAEAAHMRLEAALRPHAVRMAQGGPQTTE